MTLLDELCELAERHKDAREEERLVVKMAISLLDQLNDPQGTRPRKVRFTLDEYMRVPGRWEVVDGQLVSY